MNRRTWAWHSRPLDREMPVACFGHFGRPVVLFPTAGGDYLESERFLMLKVLTPLIDAGRVKVYSIGSISGDGWLNPDAHPAYKAELQARFDAYLVSELLPFIKDDCGGTEQRFVATGASLGAYNALNAAAKHPDWFEITIAMSGTYDFDRWMDGHVDQNYYFNMPLRWLRNLGDSRQLDLLRQSFFLIATGTGRYEAPWESDWVGDIMASKGIPHRVEKWGVDAHHDWPTWRSMLPLFLDRLA